MSKAGKQAGSPQGSVGGRTMQLPVQSSIKNCVMKLLLNAA